MRAVIRAAVILVVFGPTPTATVQAQADVGTPDVHSLALAIGERIETIRWHMGRPQELRPPIPVANVAIRENFRQAMTLWRKVNQLGVELVGGGEPPPLVARSSAGEYGASQVYQVLLSVDARLEEIRQGAGIVGNSPIDESPAPPPVDASATPDDVFQAIVQANRQVNLLLETEFQPADVYQSVQQAVFYASEILAAVGDLDPLPAAPPYEAGLTPNHVYDRLLRVFDRLAAAMAELDIRMVDWIGDAYVADQSLTPSDVFDVATLLLSELEYMHSRVPGAGPPLQAPHPGRRWPSHVYQQAGILTEQAASILAMAMERPEAFGTGR